MSKIDIIFQKIQKIIYEGNNIDLVQVLLHKVKIKEEENCCSYYLCKTFIEKIFKEIDQLVNYIKYDDKVLISVKNQKLLSTCFQLIVCLGISQCLLPGLGISLLKRSSHAIHIAPVSWTDEEKYEMLVNCTNFLERIYYIPILKNIILAFHLSDYLAALIQLSFAPLKKPGVYSNFTMTQEIYQKFSLDKQKYEKKYENIVSNCFQPLLIKELLVLQSVKDPPIPSFAKRIIAKELSRQLLKPDGLLSLIRCFIDTSSTDIGFEWKKIDMICKIVATKHGNNTEDDYLLNICSQLKNILKLENTHYLATVVACVLNLNEKYPQSTNIKDLHNEIFYSFDNNYLVTMSNLPGTIILSPQEITHKLLILHSYLSLSSVDWPVTLLIPNLYVLFLLSISCTKSNEIETKLKEIITKCLENVPRNKVLNVMKMCLFGKEHSNLKNIAVEEYDAGLAIKYVTVPVEYPKGAALNLFLKLLKGSTSIEFVEIIFENSLQFLIDISDKRKNKRKSKRSLENSEIIFDGNDEEYIVILHLLTEISTLPKVILSLKSNPLIVLNFIEHFISQNHTDSKEECVTIALVLLNTILSNSEHLSYKERLKKLMPRLKSISKHDSDCNKILCEEALTLISSGKSQINDSPCEKAIAEVFDDLLPVRAHGIITLTKLIEAKDAETISKKHYIFCLFQEQLKDTDSYIYLSAINGIVSLGTHCTEDVLHILCKEFLQVSISQTPIETKESQKQTAELRMKIGDSIVKITRNCGELTILYKTLLLNTILCGCRDDDPLIRTSALSNLAEIALVLNYKIGSIIYEILLCIWSIIETDKAVECRRAAVMVISSLLKGLEKETLVELKDNLLPIYRTLKELYRNENEDSVVRLHAQIALEELNDIVNQFLFPKVNMEQKIFVMDKAENVFK